MWWSRIVPYGRALDKPSLFRKKMWNTASPELTNHTRKIEIMEEEKIPPTFDVSFGLSAILTTFGNVLLMMSNISKYGTIFLSFHLFPPNGMYSMKRTSTAFFAVHRTKSTSSSSLTPRVTTQLIFSGTKPALSAESMPSITFSQPRRREMSSNLAGTRVSRLTLTERRPALMRDGSFRVRRIPFVVRTMSSRPGNAFKRAENQVRKNYMHFQCKHARYELPNQSINQSINQNNQSEQSNNQSINRLIRLSIQKTRLLK